MNDHSLILYLVLQLWFMTGLSFLLDQQTQHSRSCIPFGINDPFFHLQWYLNNDRRYFGINVVPAWRKCFNGTGVNIAVVDTGIDTTNQDLKNKVIRKQPPRTVLKYQHGTEVAGLIAAEANNNIFGTGVAFGAMLIDSAYVISGKNIPIADAALSVDDLNQDIDIFSCSFSRGVNGLSVYKISDSLRNTMNRGAKEGRSRKGALYVVSSGNGGRFFTPESCAYDEFKNNINAILVAGTDHSLDTIPSGEKCSAIMVTAPTRSLGFNNYPKMVTTLGNSSTDNFGLTSAAVAVASGSIAVMLSARPNLTNRDVMHILTRTAFNNMTLQYKVTDTPFVCNDAGFEVSLQYGFGLLNVDAMVEEAIKWENVGTRLECKAEFLPKHFPIFNFKASLDNFPVNQSCRISYLEHVEVTIVIVSDEAGSLTAELESPSSFSSTILHGRPLHGTTYINITVGSVQFWGQDPHGHWILTLSNEYKKFNGIIQDIHLTFYGLETAPKTVRNPCSSNRRSTRGLSDVSNKYKNTGSQMSNTVTELRALTSTTIIGITIGSIFIVGALC